jgi:MFS family permease
LALVSYLPALVVVALPPILPSMIAAYSQTPNAAALMPWLVALPGLVVAVLAWSAGWLADRYGRRGPLLISTVAFFILGTLPAFLDNFWLILATRVGLGAAQTVLLVCTTALYADYFAPDQRRTWLTAQGVITAILGPISVVIAATMAVGDWHYAFFIYALPVPILAAVGLFLYEPKRESARRDQSGPSTPFPWGIAALVTLVTLFTSTLFYVFIVHSGLALRAVGVESVKQIGLLTGAISMAAPVGSLLFNFASRKLSIGQLIALMSALISVGLLGVGAARTVPLLLTFGVVHLLGAGMCLATLILWISQLYPEEHRGRGFGLWTSAMFLGQFVCVPLLTATQIVAGGLQPAFLLLGAVGVGGTIAILLLVRAPPAGPIVLAAASDGVSDQG